MWNRLPVYLLLLFILPAARLYAQAPPEINPEAEEVRTLLVQHRYFDVIALCNKNLELADRNSDHKTHSWFLGAKGMAYLDTINPDSGKVFFEKGLTESYSINYKKSICYCLQGLGKFYYRTGNYKTSIKYFQLLNYSSLNNSDKNYSLISNYYLCANYSSLGFYSLSIVYARKAARVAYELNDTTSYIKSLISIGSTFCVLGNLDSTEYYNTKASVTYSHYSQKDLGIGADINNAFLKTSILKKEYEKGIYYGKLALQDGIKTHNFTSLNIFYDNIAICYTGLQLYDSAFFYYEKAMEIELDYNYVDEYKADLKELFYISKLIKDPEKALMYAGKYISADSLYAPVNEVSVDSLKNAFEIEKNDLALKAREENIKQLYKQKQLFYLWTGIVLLLLLTGVPYLIYLRNRLKREKEKQALLLKVKDSEIKALQSQMNPHFIFNSLNSVLEFISNAKTKEAIKYLTKFSRLIRLVLEFSNRKTILLSEELEMLKHYIDLENIRSENEFTCTFAIEDTLDLKYYEIQPMILQPFVENSIIHGIQNKVKIAEQTKQDYKGALHISLLKQGAFLKCVIGDNGIGRGKAMEIKNNKSFNHLSLGMRITKDRLDLINDGNCIIAYSDLKDESGDSSGTRVEILIPLIESF
jgi:tetratricopeptide (TPR) repeat protein